MDQELYILIPWTEAQELMKKPGFRENTYPRIEDDFDFRSYFVRKAWYDEHTYDDYCYIISKNQK